jgi:hypothetical protein
VYSFCWQITDDRRERPFSGFGYSIESIIASRPTRLRTMVAAPAARAALTMLGTRRRRGLVAELRMRDDLSAGGLKVAPSTSSCPDIDEM